MSEKRKLAIWLAWANFSEYHSQQLAAAIADRYETTITYQPLDWSEFDVVMPFFPQRKPDCERDKIVKWVWEPHEFGWAQDAGLVCAASSQVYERIRKRYGNRALYLPWGVNPQHFAPFGFPVLDEGRVIVGWCGMWKNPRKQYLTLKAVMEQADGITFKPNVTEMDKGRQVGPYTMEEMYQYYASIHVYVCGSASEGFHFPFLEGYVRGAGRCRASRELARVRRGQRAGRGGTLDVARIETEVARCA
jgi:hypothetical protein